MNEISEKVLFVDDEVNFLEGVRRQLRRSFDITTAVGGQEGLAALQREGPFAVVISDYNMPNMNGVDFLREVQAASPGTVSAMLTGRAELAVAVEALHEGHIFRFLNKPCSRERLARTIRDCLEQYRLLVSERWLKAELAVANEQLRQLNAGLEERVAERTATIRRLHAFVSGLNGLDTLEGVAEHVVATTAEVLHSRRVSLLVPDTEGTHLSIVAARGLPDDVKQRVRIPVGKPIAGRVFAESKSVVVNHADQLERGDHDYETDLFASVPLASTSLSTPGGPVGVLNVTEPIGGDRYDDDKIAELKAIAEAAAIAIRNQIRLCERNEARDATIFALAKLAEYRDPETGAHLERVQAYCRLLSETLAEMPEYASVVDRAFIETIVRSSPLHDIGKVGIPDHILLKPGKLTAEEFDVMKRHAAIGGDTIKALVEQGRRQAFLQMGMDIAYSHHEKFNGKGYPKGLAGGDIPLPARILAVADVYDALTSKRVYKSAMPHEKAVSIIQTDSGTHFDPDVVNAFTSRLDEFDRIRHDLTERIEEADALAASSPPPPEARRPAEAGSTPSENESVLVQKT